MNPWKQLIEQLHARYGNIDDARCQCKACTQEPRLGVEVIKIERESRNVSTPDTTS